jgi:hypothetical protein
MATGPASGRRWLHHPLGNGEYVRSTGNCVCVAIDAPLDCLNRLDALRFALPIDTTTILMALHEAGMQAGFFRSRQSKILSTCGCDGSGLSQPS